MVAPAAAIAAVVGADDSSPSWRDRAARVPTPLWAVAGVFVLLVVVAGAANLTGSGGSSPTNPGRATLHTPAVAGTKTSPTSPTTSASVHSTPPTHTPKPPKDHGPKPGHKGKGHK